MPEINYSVDCKLSNFEWFLIREVRRLQQFGYGDITMKLVNSEITEIKSSQTFGGKDLKEIQSL